MSFPTYQGQQQPTSGATPFNANAFLIQQMFGRLTTSTLVMVVSCTNDGELSPVGYVDVQPLVNQLDGANNAVPHGIIYGVPYFRMQGGTDAIIMDPKPGDIGMAAFADHDISSVKKNKAASNPGSKRRFSMADAMYFGGFLNADPVQFIRFATDGVYVVSPSKIHAAAPLIEWAATDTIVATAPNGIFLNGLEVDSSGNATTDGDVTAGDISVKLHHHNVVKVQIGSSTISSTESKP